MRYHRTFGPPSNPGHGRGSAPYGHRIRQAARGEEQVGLLKNNAPVANRALELSLELAWLWLNISLNIASARNFSACSRSYLNFVSTPTKPTIYSKARRHNIKEQRAERLRTKGKLSVTSRGSSHISRVSTREHPETHEPTHVVPEHKDQSNAFEGNKQLPTCFLSTSKYL